MALRFLLSLLKSGLCASSFHLFFGHHDEKGGLPVLVQLQTRLPPFSYVEYVSFMRYGLEAFYVAEAQHWTQVRAQA